METQDQLNQKILEILSKIQNEHPELTKYLKEMPVTYAETASDEIKLSHLKRYYNSLNELLESYAEQH